MGAFLLVSWTALGAPAIGQVPTLPPVVDADVERTLRLADADDDGAISRNEAIRAKLSLSEKKTFDDVDQDHNGLITLFELGEALRARIRAWDSGADRDGDGELNEEEAGSSPSLSKVFVHADANRDGRVSRQEYEAFSRQDLYGNVDLPSVVPNIFEKRF